MITREKKNGDLLTLFTYWQAENEALRRGNCDGNSSRDAERSAEAAIIEGLYSKNFMSWTKQRSERGLIWFRVINLDLIECETRHKNGTVLGSEDKLWSTVLESLHQLRLVLVHFEERREEREEGERRYGSHSPTQSVENQKLHLVNRLCVEDEAIFSLFHQCQIQFNFPLN